MANLGRLLLRRTGPVAVALVLAACSAPCAKVSCVPHSLFVDLHHLPSEWLRDGRFELCADAICNQVRSFPDSPVTDVIARLGPSGAAPKKISLRVVVKGRALLDASTDRRFAVWTKTSSCPDCKLGSVFVSVDRTGHFSPDD